MYNVRPMRTEQRLSELGSHRCLNKPKGLYCYTSWHCFKAFFLWFSIRLYKALTIKNRVLGVILQLDRGFEGIWSLASSDPVIVLKSPNLKPEIPKA